MQGNRSRTWADVGKLEGKTDKELAGMVRTQEDLQRFIVLDKSGNHSIPHGSIMLELPANVKKHDKEREENWFQKAYERGIRDFETLLEWPECFHNEPCVLNGGVYKCKFSKRSTCAFTQAYFTMKEEEEEDEVEEVEHDEPVMEESVDDTEDFE